MNDPKSEPTFTQVTPEDVERLRRAVFECVRDIIFEIDFSKGRYDVGIADKESTECVDKWLSSITRREDA